MADGDWHKLVRRAYGVPDVVTSETAAAHLAFRLAQAVVGNDDPRLVGEVPGKFLEVLERAGDAGQLDGYLVELPHFDKEQVAVALAQEAGCGLEGATTMLQAVIQRVQAFLNSHPFAS